MLHNSSIHPFLCEPSVMHSADSALCWCLGDIQRQNWLRAGDIWVSPSLQVQVWSPSDTKADTCTNKGEEDGQIIPTARASLCNCSSWERGNEDVYQKTGEQKSWAPLSTLLLLNWTENNKSGLNSSARWLCKDAPQAKAEFGPIWAPSRWGKSILQGHLQMIGSWLPQEFSVEIIPFSPGAVVNLRQGHSSGHRVSTTLIEWSEPGWKSWGHRLQWLGFIRSLFLHLGII